MVSFHFFFSLVLIRFSLPGCFFVILVLWPGAVPRAPAAAQRQEHSAEGGKEVAAATHAGGSKLWARLAGCMNFTLRYSLWISFPGVFHLVVNPALGVRSVQCMVSLVFFTSFYFYTRYTSHKKEQVWSKGADFVIYFSHRSPREITSICSTGQKLPFSWSERPWGSN